MNLASEPGEHDSRELVRALRKLPHGEPPADFARQVASAAQGGLQWWERCWLLAPGFACVPASWYLAQYHRDAWAASVASLTALLPDASHLNWLLAASACLALSWVFTKLRPAHP